MESSELKLHMAVKLLTNSKRLKAVSTFLLILDKKKQFTYKILKERRIALASVVGLDNLSSNSRIIILLLIKKGLSSSKNLLSHHLPYICRSMYG